MRQYFHTAAEEAAFASASYELLAIIDAILQVKHELASGRYGRHFVAFTDGSCTPYAAHSPEGPGGWATILFGSRGERWEMHGEIPATTSNRAEVCGLLAALACLPVGANLGLQSDSRYLVDHVRAGCRANDNHGLWAEVREMLVAKDIHLTASWVPAHCGLRHNERADALASGRIRYSRLRAR